MWPLTNGYRCLDGSEADLFRGAVGMMVDALVLQLNLNETDHDQVDEIVAPEADWSWPPADDSDYDGGGMDDLTGLVIPHHFAMWEPEQQLWLLERVATSVLGTRPAPPAAAVFEATVEAVYVEVGDLIAMEIAESSPIEPSSWRQALLDAFASRCPEDSLLEAMHIESTAIDPCLPPAIVRQLKKHGYDPEQPFIDSESDGDDKSTANESHSAGNAPTSEDTKASRQRDWFAWWAMITGRLVDATFGPRLYHDIEAYRDGDPAKLVQVLQEKGVNRRFTRRIPPLRTKGQTQATVDRLQRLVFKDS